MIQKANKPLLWIASGSIGDMLMVLAVCEEAVTRDAALRNVIFVRRYHDIARDLARNVPRTTIVPLVGLRGAFRLAATLLGRWTFISPWRTKGTAANFTRLFVLNPMITVVRFAHVMPIGLRDKTLKFDHDKLMIENFRNLMRRAGLPVSEEGTPITLPLSLRRPAEAFPRRDYFVVNPFGSAESRSFPPRRMRGLLQRLVQEYPHHEFVMLATRDNEAAARNITRGLPHMHLAVQLPILQVAGLIDASSVYVGVDTGITHLACILGHKSVVLGNRADPRWLPYYNPHTRILFNETRCTCDGHKGGNCFVEEDGKRYYRCLYDISDDVILDAMRQISCPIESVSDETNTHA